MFFKKQYAFLSNFYHHKIEYKGRVYPTAENAFQAQKFEDPKIQAFFETVEPNVAKVQGRQMPGLRPDWESVKLAVMEDVLRVKFSDPELAKALVEVTEPIEETNSWRDTYWGVYNGLGQNHLGKILTKIREDIIKENGNVD